MNKLKYIAECLEDGNGPDIEELLVDNTTAPRLTEEERKHLAVIVHWARLPTKEPLTDEQILACAKYWSNSRFVDGAERFILEFSRHLLSKSKGTQ